MRYFRVITLGALAFVVVGALARSNAGLNYRQIPDAKKYVFLTFDAHPCKKTMLQSCDDIPSIEGAVKLLETLKKLNIRCTFFFTGQFIETYPQVVRQAIRDGHEIGSHLYTHTHPLELQAHGGFTKAWFLNELLSAEKALQKTGNGHAVKLFRMPYGMSSYFSIPGGPRKILEWAKEAGYIHVDWTVDTLDWISKSGSGKGTVLPPYLTSTQMKDRILSEEPKGGVVVLSHLTRFRPWAEPSVNEMLPTLMDQLKTRKVATARLSDFLLSDKSRPPDEAAHSADSKASSCNYSWNFKRVHICIQGMRSNDCDELQPDFMTRTQDCECLKPGVKYDLQNMGEVVQISCKF